MNTDSPGAFVAQLSWPDVERRINAGAVAVLPVGAACKAHGSHLPLNTDLLQAEWLAGALVRSAEVLVWPTVSYGYYPAFSDYPGSVSLACDTFQRLVQEILSDIQNVGVCSLLIVNTGISTIGPLQAAINDIPKEMRIELANVYAGPHCLGMIEAIAEQPYGGHADEIETSIMLAIDRELVAMNKAVTWAPHAMSARGPFSRSDSGNPDFCPAGVWGDPTLASEDKGRRILSAIVDDLLAAITTFR